MDTWLILLIVVATVAVVAAIAAAVKNSAKKERRGTHGRPAGESGEAAVSSVLKECDSGTAIVIDNYMVLEEGQSRQIDHICICSNGVFVIETKNFAGTIYGNENMRMWQQYIRGKKYEFYSPVKQNLTHLYCIKKLLPKNVPLYQYVVFAYGDISHVSAENVTDIFSLRQAIDGQKSFRILSAEEKLSLNEQLLAARADGISDHMHIMEIKTSQLLVENNICPRCRIPLERRTGEDGVYYACPHCKFVKK